MPKISIVISCTVFTAFVISGALFSTYLLHKLDVLEAEVRVGKVVK